VGALESGDAEVWLKLEHLQVTGSFKVRGALARIATLSDKEKRAGIVACSAGNHALGVAHACDIHGVPATIFLPKSIDPARRKILEDSPVTLHYVEGGYEASEKAARAHAASSGVSFISPYNDPMVIAGQGSIGIEILHQIPHVDVVFLAVGGGGLAGGVAAYIKAVKPDVEIVGVSPANSAHMFDIVTGIPGEFTDHLETLSDSTAGPVQEGSVTIDLCKALIDHWILVEEGDIAAAMRLLFFESRLVVEGAGALTTAADLKEHERFQGKTCALVVCGGNIDPNRFLSLVSAKG
jgi:threonine dehydratase